MWRGKMNATQDNHRKIFTKDIPALIRAVLRINHFRVGMKVFKQIRGSPMGSPASPALCAMVVAVNEQMWSDSYRHILQPSNLFFRTRYVDNRLMILPKRLLQLQCMQEILSPEFYQAPIILEDEPGYQFLGFDVKLQEKRIVFCLPKDTDEFLHANSASTSATLLSSFSARILTAKKNCFPDSEFHKAANALVALFQQCGYEVPLLSATVESIAKRADSLCIGQCCSRW